MKQAGKAQNARLYRTLSATAHHRPVPAAADSGPPWPEIPGDVAIPFASVIADLERLPSFMLYGRVTAVLGMLVEVGGIERALSIGDRCQVVARDERRTPCEVVGVRTLTLNASHTFIPLASGALSAAVGMAPVFLLLAAGLLAGARFARLQVK